LFINNFEIIEFLKDKGVQMNDIQSQENIDSKLQTILTPAQYTNYTKYKSLPYNNAQTLRNTDNRIALKKSEQIALEHLDEFTPRLKFIQNNRDLLKELNNYIETHNTKNFKNSKSKLSELFYSIIKNNEKDTAYNIFLESYTENVNNNNTANAKLKMENMWNYNP